jgi:hypothetical protein
VIASAKSIGTLAAQVVLLLGALAVVMLHMLLAC